MAGKSAEFVSLFKEVAGGQNYFEAWNATVSTLAALLATAAQNDCSWLAERADASLAALPGRVREAMPSLHDAIVEALEEEPWQDLLGDSYMRIGIGSKENGQFFTPYHLARLCAVAALPEQGVREDIERHGYVSVNEPAAGGGANVIAAADVLLHMGINYQRSALFVAQELSELTAITCYVQMSLLGMPGIVMIGDTLKLEERFELWTPALALDEIWLWRMVGGGSSDAE